MLSKTPVPEISPCSILMQVMLLQTKQGTHLTRRRLHPGRKLPRSQCFCSVCGPRCACYQVEFWVLTMLFIRRLFQEPTGILKWCVRSNWIMIIHIYKQFTHFTRHLLLIQHRSFTSFTSNSHQIHIYSPEKSWCLARWEKHRGGGRCALSWSPQNSFGVRKPRWGGVYKPIISKNNMYIDL